MKPAPKVVATGPWDQPGWDDGLRAAGCHVVLGPSIDERPQLRLDDDELRALCGGAEAILVSTRESISGAILDAAPDLKLLVKATIGVERVDIAGATERSVLVVNSPAPENFVGLAEATVGLIVAMAKSLLEKEQRVRDGGWRDAGTDGVVLAGRTIGIIGLGRVGSRVARRLLGWDVQLLSFDPYVPPTRFDEVGVRSVDLRTVLTTSDVLTVHVPLTSETKGMISSEELALMRPGAFLVNTSRGPVVDERAVAASLLNGSLAGAALDVFEDEPLPADSPIREVPRDRLILTPHSIGSSRASRRVGTQMAVVAILRALDGCVPDHVLNPEALDGWLARWGAPLADLRRAE